MRVLVVYPRFDFFGGAELVVVRFCNFLTAQNVEHALLTTQMVYEVERELHGTEVILAPVKHDRLYTKFFALLQKLRKVEKSFDVVSFHNFPSEFLAAFTHLPSTWLCNEPELFLILVSGTLSPLKKWLFSGLLSMQKRLVRNRITECFVADAGNASRFRSIFGLEPTVIPYGIDYDFFSQPATEDIRKKYDLVDAFLLLQVGTLSPYKNQLASLSVLSCLRNRIPNIRLILAGSGEVEYRQKLLRYIDDHSLAPFVVFAGHVDRSAIRDLFYGCDLLLHPVTDQGGWLAPFEALSSGLPVVVCPELMAADIFSDHEIGVVTENLPEPVLECFLDRGRLLQMAEKGREWVKMNLDWDNFCEKMLSGCKRALSENSNVSTRRKNGR